MSGLEDHLICTYNRVMKRTQEDYIKLQIRLPPELHEATHKSAEANERSFNAEIIAILRATLLTGKQEERKK